MNPRRGLRISETVCGSVLKGEGARLRSACRALLFVAALALYPLVGQAQTVTATVTVGTAPQAVAVNPITNKVYAANFGTNNVTAIDGATNMTTNIDANGNEPVAGHAPGGSGARLDFALPGLALAITIVVMNGCGGSNTPPLPPVAKGTPPGNYTLTVTMTATTSSAKKLTHNQQLTLTVQ